MFEDSKTELYVCSVTNANAAITALPNNAGAFYKTSDHTIEEDALEAGVEYEFIFRNSKGVLNKTRPFTSADIVGSPVYMATTARQEQVTYVGYNGVSGSMDAANSTYYGLKLVLNHTFGMLNNSPLMLTIPYQSDSSATQSEVAAGLAIAGTKVLNRQAHKPIKIERVNSGAQLVDLDNLSFVHGSTYFTSADDDTANILVGSIIRVEEPENDGEAVTDPCYVVVGAVGAGAACVYELDQPFQGVTNAEHDHCGTVTEGNWGLKFTGISVTDANFDPVNDEPFVVNFDVELGENFETATVTESVQSFIGRGTYQLIAAQEAYTQFQNKTREVSAYPRTTYLQSAVAGDTYAVFSFLLKDEKYINVGSGQSPISLNRINIAVKTGFDEVAEFTTVLTAITGSTA